MEKLKEINGFSLDEITVNKDYVLDLAGNVSFNRQLLKYYAGLVRDLRYIQDSKHREKVNNSFTNVALKDKKMAQVEYLRKLLYAVAKVDEETSGSMVYEKVSTLKDKFQAMSVCNDFWFLDVYEKEKIKDMIATNLCKDKFCANCKKVKQASRMSRFIPHIEKYKEHGLYHLVLTVPNVDGLELKATIKKMFKSFATLIEYFKCKKKIRGIDFSKFNYLGAIRSLEVTFKGDSYHPHLHVLLCMDYELQKKDQENSFSWRQGVLSRLFSHDEIIIQKAWSLLMNSEKVTKKNIDKLDLGYSCMIDEFKEDDYFELFKYMTKASSSNDVNESKSLLGYKNFVTLYFSLKHVRQIQGYGCFFRIKDIDYDDTVLLHWDTFISTLSEPRQVSNKLSDLIVDEEYTLISRKRVYTYLRKILDKDKENE
ncbi:protein rep [Bacillus cereus]|nr:protein rep [Bacillus cereus]